MIYFQGRGKPCTMDEEGFIPYILNAKLVYINEDNVFSIKQGDRCSDADFEPYRDIKSVYRTFLKESNRERITRKERETLIEEYDLYMTQVSDYINNDRME